MAVAVVECEEQDDESARGQTAERAGTLDEDDVGSIACRGDGGRCAGRPAADHQDLCRGIDRCLTRRFVDELDSRSSTGNRRMLSTPAVIPCRGRCSRYVSAEA